MKWSGINRKMTPLAEDPGMSQYQQNTRMIVDGELQRRPGMAAASFSPASSIGVLGMVGAYPTSGPYGVVVDSSGNVTGFPVVGPIWEPPKLKQPVRGKSFILVATLSWGDFSDLDLYVSNVTDGGVAWYASRIAGGLSLNQDTHPGCAAAPVGPEITTGTFTASKTFSVWYNQFSNCLPETAPAIKQVQIFNNGNLPITVNGNAVLAGGNLLINNINYAGYNTGGIPGFVGGTAVVVI